MNNSILHEWIFREMTAPRRSLDSAIFGCNLTTRLWVRVRFELTTWMTESIAPRRCLRAVLCRSGCRAQMKSDGKHLVNTCALKTFLKNRVCACVHTCLNLSEITAVPSCHAAVAPSSQITHSLIQVLARRGGGGAAVTPDLAGSQGREGRKGRRGDKVLRQSCPATSTTHIASSASSCVAPDQI